MREMELEDQAVSKPPLIGLATIAVFAVLLIGALAFLASRQWSSDARAGVIASARSSTAAEVEIMQGIQARVRNEQEDRERLDRTLTEAHVSELLAQVAESRAVVDRAQEALGKWNELIPALLTSDSGERLAADAERVRLFHALYTRLGRPSETSVAAIGDRVDALERELQQIKESQDARLPNEAAAVFTEQLHKDRAAAQEALHTVKADLDAVADLVAQAAHDIPAPRTLEAALQALESEAVARRAELIAAERERVDAAQNELDRQMEGQGLEKIRTAQRERAKALLEDRATQEATAADIATREAKARDLKTRAEDPTVQANYQPFLGLGKTQPVNKNPSYGTEHCYWQAVPGLEKKPASRAALEAAKAFERLEVFIAFATSPSNDRKGAWSPLDPDDQKTLAQYRERWEEFQKLVPIWVQTGKLGN